LAWIGLIQVLPMIALAIPAGQVVDRMGRRRVLMVALATMALGSLGLARLSATHGSLWGIYGCVLLIGIAKAFQQPAKSAFLPLLVPRAALTGAVTWSSGGFQLASVVGPALGGLLLAMFRRADLVYLLDALGLLVFISLLACTRVRSVSMRGAAVTWESLVAGVTFVFRSRLMLAAMALDMFAVLLGGAITLLPVYASDILMVGEMGLGLLQAAPALGAVGMAFALAHRPPLARAGRALLLAVAGFGAATIVFGYSRWFPLSLAMLFVTGALDNISVVVRQTLVQVLTPDAMRGRVSAVNSMFIGASNELGGFESGVVARIFTPTFSVVSGGAGTLVVVFLVAISSPSLRRLGRLDRVQPE